MQAGDYERIINYNWPKGWGGWEIDAKFERFQEGEGLP